MTVGIPTASLGAYYPGRLNVPLHDWLVGTVGRLETNGDRLGTCFLVRVHATDTQRGSADHGYVVTARHNLYLEDGSTSRSSVDAVVPTSNGLPPGRMSIPFDRWYRHPREDLAAALWYGAEDKRRVQRDNAL